MKIRLFLISVLIFTLIIQVNGQLNEQGPDNLNAQSPDNCENVNMNIGPISNGGTITNNRWAYTHGTPNIGPNGFWLWSNANKGEGITYSYQFHRGQTYKIRFKSITNTDQHVAAANSSYFNIYAIVNPMPFNSTIGTNIPSIPPNSKEILKQKWKSFSQNGTNGAIDYKEVTFTADREFSRLWFFPKTNRYPQIQIAIEELTICHVVPSCDCDYTIVNMDIGNPSNGGPISNNQWSYSHGSPTINHSSFLLNAKAGKGEGINYSGYQFQAGRQYCIQFKTKTNSSTQSAIYRGAKFNIMATNSPILGNVTISGLGNNPSYPQNYQYFFEQTWQNFGGGGLNGTVDSYQISFTALSNFNNLWFFPENNIANKSVSIKVYDIKICEFQESVDDSDPDTSDSRHNSNIVLEDYKENNNDYESNDFINISPNPNKGEFTISSDTDLKIQKIIIYDSDNRLIKEVQINKTKSFIQINEKPGIYMIQILLENNEILTKKVVIL